MDILITSQLVDQLGPRLPTSVEDLQPAEASHRPMVER